jgi:hypothetical protein
MATANEGGTVNDERTFEQLLGDPYEQFDRRSEILASIDAYAKAVPATASGPVCTCPKAECEFHTASGLQRTKVD